MDQEIIQNNEKWYEIREKMNNVIQYVNEISENGEKPNIDDIEEDTFGSKLVKGSKIIFQSSVNGRIYKIDAEVFFDKISKGL